MVWEANFDFKKKFNEKTVSSETKILKIVVHISNSIGQSVLMVACANSFIKIQNISFSCLLW